MNNKQKIKWAEGLTADDLPGDLALVANECGLDVALALAEKMPSVPVYIRPISGLIRKKKEAYIIKHFTGSNHKQLALDTGYSERWIYEVLSRRREERSKQPLLFED